MKDESYIKLFRRIMEWEHYKDGNAMRVFMHLLLLAAHDRKNLYGVILKRGQCITSSRRLQDDLGMCAQYVTDSIKKLKESGEITTERACGGMGGTVFTIANYDEYQGTERSRKSAEGFDGTPKKCDKGW